MAAVKSHLTFEFAHRSDSGKTSVHSVKTLSGDALGCIKWYAPWRRYVLLPHDQVLFDAACLREITEFIDDLMNLRDK